MKARNERTAKKQFRKIMRRRKFVDTYLLPLMEMATVCIITLFFGAYFSITTPEYEMITCEASNLETQCYTEPVDVVDIEPMSMDDELTDVELLKPVPMTKEFVTCAIDMNEHRDMFGDEEGMRILKEEELDGYLQKSLEEIANEYDIPFEIMMAVCEHESRYQIDAVSQTSDYGLFQINICNHKFLAEQYGLTDMFDPIQNMEAGAIIISRIRDEGVSDWNCILMAYNMGTGGAQKLWDEGIYSSQYSRSILSKAEEFREEM